MEKTIEHKRSSQAGITLIETLFAGAILIIGSVGMLSLIVDAIATNNRQNSNFRCLENSSIVLPLSPSACRPGRIAAQIRL